MSRNALRWQLLIGVGLLTGVMATPLSLSPEIRSGTWLDPSQLNVAARVTSPAPSDPTPTRSAAVDAAQTVPPSPGESSFEALLAPLPSPTTGVLRPTRHVVREGETLVAIADRYGLRPETLVWANDLDDADLIVVDQELIVPPADGLLYTVEDGEGLAQIAGRYGVELAQVATANALGDPDLLQTGETLFLPGARPLASSAGSLADSGGAGRDASATVAAAATLASLELAPTLQAVLEATWEQAARETWLYGGAGPDAAVLGRLPAGARVERVGGLAGARVPVRDPGDGQSRLAMSGWIDALDLAPSSPPSPRELPRSYPENARMDIPQAFAPYRSQLDGSAYAAANCGPTTISMALAAFGIDASPGALRPEVLAAQRIWGNDVGSRITALAEVTESYGLKTVGLRDESGAVRRWTLNDLRAQLRDKRPVVVQVAFRGLPGRERAAFNGDHYILLTGLLDDSFLYNDSINNDGLGWDRVVSGARLEHAMNATDRRHAYAAFALSR